MSDYSRRDSLPSQVDRYVGMSENILRYFIVEETGTTHFLATLLDPSTDPEIRRVQEGLWQKLKQRLLRYGVALGGTAPYALRCGFGAPEVDLAIGWGRWVVAIENKIQSASIEKGQLQRQYAGLKQQVKQAAWGRTGFESNPQICMVLLSPDETIGTAEFELLDVDQLSGDAKARVTWEDFLSWLSELAWPRTTEGQVAVARLATDGAEATMRLIEKGRARERKYPDTPTRRRFREFIVQLREEIARRSIELSLPRPLHFRPDWALKNGWEIYADLEGLPGRAIYLRINWHGDLSDDSHWNLWGRVWCRLERRGLKACRASFDRLRREQIQQLVNVNRGLAGHCDRVKWTKIEAGQDYEISGAKAELSDLLASWFLAYVKAFMAVLGPQESELDMHSDSNSGHDIEEAAHETRAKKRK